MNNEKIKEQLMEVQKNINLAIKILKDGDIQHKIFLRELKINKIL